MRIQEGIDARNASIKQAAAWQVEGEGMAERYVFDYSLLSCYFQDKTDQHGNTNRNPTTEVDIDPAIALPYPVHQHDRNPNSIGTEQYSELHMERPSKQDPPLSETEHFDINEVPAEDSNFKSVFSSALFVVCCPCLALKPRSYNSDGKGRPLRADNIPLQGEILQNTEHVVIFHQGLPGLLMVPDTTRMRKSFLLIVYLQPDTILVCQRVGEEFQKDTSLVEGVPEPILFGPSHLSDFRPSMICCAFGQQPMRIVTMSMSRRAPNDTYIATCVDAWILERPGIKPGIKG